MQLIDRCYIQNNSYPGVPAHQKLEFKDSDQNFSLAESLLRSVCIFSVEHKTTVYCQTVFSSLQLLSEPEYSVSAVKVHLRTEVQRLWCSYAVGVTEPPRLHFSCRSVLKGLSDLRRTHLLCLLQGLTPNVQQNYGTSNKPARVQGQFACSLIY